MPSSGVDDAYGGIVGRKKRPDKEAEGQSTEPTQPEGTPAGSADEIEDWLFTSPLGSDTAPGDLGGSKSSGQGKTWSDASAESDTQWFQKQEEAPTDPTGEEPIASPSDATEDILGPALSGAGSAPSDAAAAVPIDDLLVDLDGGAGSILEEPVRGMDEPAPATQDPMATARSSRMVISLGVGTFIALMIVLVAGIPWGKLMGSAETTKQVELAELEALTNAPSDPRLRGIEVRENLRGRPEDLVIDPDLLPDVALEPVFSGGFGAGLSNASEGQGAGAGTGRAASSEKLVPKIHRATEVSFMDGARVIEAGSRPTFSEPGMAAEAAPTDGGLLQITSNRPVVVYLNGEPLGKNGAWDRLVQPGAYTIRAMIPEQPDSEVTRRVVVEEVGQVVPVHFTF